MILAKNIKILLQWNLGIRDTHGTEKTVLNSEVVPWTEVTVLNSQVVLISQVVLKTDFTVLASGNLAMILAKNTKNITIIDFFAIGRKT